ncbi:MAG TPA: GNAT family N-acetyltransferase [Candidatus Acidoferrum sp.]|nr:GNAT family N-acetyltransferase [Candidatus Acidoferrum sp.]
MLFRGVAGRTLAVVPSIITETTIRRAALDELDAAYRIVLEYYQAAGVVARESRENFREYYFGPRNGVWLAQRNKEVVGCIALRELGHPLNSGEIKRMYVQPAHRQHGVAKALLDSIERFAIDVGYDWLYLDSAPGMDTAINFYKRHGYAECGRYNDNPQANIFLRRQLR